jgi:hypothetical protein
MKSKSMILWLLIAALSLLLSVSECFAQQKKEVKFFAKEPALITSAGQSADTQMVKVLADRNKFGYRFHPSGGIENLQGVKSVIIVIGGSTKGMGAAGIDTDKEVSRIQQLLTKAQELKIPVIGIHIGGKARRGDLSDRFINLVAPKSSCLIVVKEGDSDEIFSKIASKNNIPITLVDKISDTQQSLKSIYGK